jgi:hypothetical protein
MSRNQRKRPDLALGTITLLALVTLLSQTPEQRRARVQAMAQATQTVQALLARPTQTALARAHAAALALAHARAQATARAQAHAAATAAAVATQEAMPTSTPSAAQWAHQASPDTYADVNDHPDLHQGDAREMVKSS